MPRTPRSGSTLKALPLRIAGEGGEAAWIDVIRKMDEVYSELLQYEVALEKKNAALEETQQFLYSVLVSMSDILVVCDRQWTIREVNPATTRLLGRDDEALRGSAILDLFADEASRELASKALAHLPQEHSTDCEVLLTGPDGAPIPVSMNCSPRLSTSGKLVGAVLAGRPVGELRRAYQALREAHEDLKRAQQQLVQSEKMASLGRLVAGVAHELNNPISFVLGNVHALQRYSLRLARYLDAVHGGADPDTVEALRAELRIDRMMEDLKPLIEGTIEGAERTRDIVDGLKRFSAVDRSESQVFNLSEVIETAVHWVSKAGRADFRVSTRLPAELPVCGSAGQMQQVIINLVQNALDACEARAPARLDIEGGVERRQVVVRFHDHGPGIDPDALPRVFDPFFTTKPVGQGTGLGLSISYGIVERHGGKLSAANHPQGGAVFSLHLPLAS